ncbi:unnamed protein product [Closterium sp. NIES-54]
MIRESTWSKTTCGLCSSRTCTLWGGGRGGQGEGGEGVGWGGGSHRAEGEILWEQGKARGRLYKHCMRETLKITITRIIITVIIIIITTTIIII